MASNRKLEERRARRALYAERDAAYEATQNKLTERAAGLRAEWDEARPTYEDPQLVHDAEQRKVADIISQGRKAPMTWDEVNSHGAGGVDA